MTETLTAVWRIPHRSAKAFKAGRTAKLTYIAAVFERGHGFNPGESGLAFLGLVVGMVISVAYIIFYVNPSYIKLAHKSEGGRAPPEARLPPSIIGAVLLVIGLAWFAATDGPSVHWIVPILA